MSTTGDGDKRPVSTDALETLGSILSPGEKRDAIHLAVEPTIAKEHLMPGDDVGVDGSRAKPHVGIVDPFLKRPVEAGQLFWLVIYPRQIHSLRHVWTHPAFPDVPEVLGEAEAPRSGPDVAAQQIIDSELWLRVFCETHDCPPYEEVLAKAVDNDSWDPESLHFDGHDAHGDIPPEFWQHVEIVTGLRFEDPPKYFSCAC